MEGGRLTAESLSSLVPQFNWVFLVELIVCGVLTLFFLFYFNRLFATIVSYPIRAYTWHYYGVYVDIHALQISLLGGRIFFKGFRYHGENETILVQSGYLTWKYWLRSVRKVDISRSSEDGAESSRHPVGESDSEESTRSPSPSAGQRGGGTETHRLPCRLELTLHGLEWFVYNRSAAYDSILSGFGYTPESGSSGSDNDQNDHTGENNDEELESRNSPQTGNGSSGTEDFAKSPSGAGSRPPERSKSAQNTHIRLSHEESPPQEYPKSCSSSSTEEASRSKLLALLPLGLVCNKGAMVMGNENTKTFLTAKFERASGHIDARNSGPLDMFRQIFEFRLRHPVVQMKPNPDFKQSQQAAASGLRASDGDQESERHEKGLHSRYKCHRRRIWHNLRDLIPYFQSSVESFHVYAGKETRGASSGSPTRTGLPGESRWLGLTRYLDEDDRDAHEGWSAIEYGRFSTLIDCPSLRFNYYWDIPGKVPRGGMHSRLSVHKLSNDINGADPPEWGMHLCIKGGTINYGPWADRERVGIQTIFFPNFYRDSLPSAPLEADAPRQSTKFKLTIDIEQDTTLRIPTREASKDWLWKGRVDAVGGISKLKSQKQKKHPRNTDAEKSTHGPDIRPFGWFAIRIAANSNIRYSMDMVASNTGYNNQLDLDLSGSRVTSSVNHGLLWSSGAQTISFDLSNPLKWNILHAWSINVYSQNFELFLLRDHIFLLTDLVNDWISGPPPDFYTFVPFRYNINFSFDNFKLFMNVNDSNIINNPSDTNDNTFLVIHSEHLASNVTIPVEKYRPKNNAIGFDLDLSNGSIELVTPLWNTQRVFLQDNSVATLKAMSLTGSYKYNIETSSELTDRLTLNIVGVSPKLCIYGFLIRYFLMIKENYFGDHLHFKTLEEYQGLLATVHTPEESSAVNPSPKTNDLDVFVQIHADKGSIFLPANIYDRTNCVRIDTVSFDTDLRFTNYYMDMETSFGPAEFVIDSTQPDGSHISSNTQLFLDGLSIYGHRLFGLPPTEPTYVCNWDFRVGHIAGECTPTFLKYAASAIRFLAFSFDDEENALPPLHPVIIHDVTFLRAKVNCIRIWVLVEESAILFSSGVVDLDFNDWADLQFSERLNLNLPDLILAVVDRKAAIRLREPSRETVRTYGYFQTSLLFKMVERKSNFFVARGLQQDHIRVHDQRSNRTPWLLHSDENTFLHPTIDTSNPKVSPPAIHLPLMPEPIQSIPRFYPGSSSSSSTFPYTTSGKSSIRSSRSSESRREDLPHFNHMRTATIIPNSRIPGPTSFGSGVRDARIASKSEGAHSPRHGARERDKLPSFGHGISSPWAMPYFQFNGIEPDVADVPTFPHTDALPEQSEWDLGSDIAIDSGPKYDNSTQVFFHCGFKPGLRGLGSPEALSAVSSLFDELQPSQPVDIIDNLQASVISDILAYEKAMARPKKFSNFSLIFPHSHIRFINSSMSMDEDRLGNFRDQYDLKLAHIRATCRTAVESKRDDHVQPTKTSFTMHVAADSVSLSAHGEKIEALDREGLVHCTLKNIICWSASEPTQRSHLQIQDIETVTSSKSVQDSAFLIDRTTNLVNSIVAPFQESSAAYTRRLRCLVYTLTNHGSQTPDPLFLTRTSYVLRAAQDHLRLHDSWKIISRLRNIYNHLPAGQISKLACDCKANMIPCPPDARTTVLSNFDRWRTWDLAHVKKSVVMKVIWGNGEEGNNNLATSTNQAFTLNMNKIRFCLDPGPKESELLLQGFSSSMSVAESSMKQPATGGYRSIAVQTYCSNISLGLKWEICELVEGIVKMISGRQKQTGAPSHVALEAKPTTKGDDIHLVFLTDDGSVVIDGININVALRGSGIKGSVIHKPSGQDSRSSTSVIVSSYESSVQFSSRLKDLMVWRLISPNVFVSHTSQISGTRIKHDWRSAAACQRLRYDMNEDPLGIIQVVDRIVEDEVKYIMGLVSFVEPSQTQPAVRPNTPKKKIIHRFHVAMFLHDYDIRFLLLPSLIYAISGEVARLSIAPAKGSKLELDFDVKSNSHKFWTDNERDSSIISALDIPPINGRVMVATPPNRTSLDIDTTIELTKVDAGAVRNLLGALNGPEISHLLADLEHDTRILSQHFDRLISRGRSSPKTKPSDRAIHDLVYKVRLTLAGVDIFATAPGLSNKDYSADMNFRVGLVQFHLENASLNGPILHHPEFNLLLSRISFDLKKRDKVNTQPYGSVLLDAQIFGTSKINEYGDAVRSYDVVNNGLQIELYAETASMIVDIAAHLQERLKTLDLSQEVKHLRKLRLITAAEKRPSMEVRGQQPDTQSLFNAMYSVVLANIQVSWMISAPASCHQGRQPEDLVFSIRKVELATRRQNAARLRIEDMQLQMVPLQRDKRARSRNSALLPEAVFNVAYLSIGNERRLAFQAAGKELDIRMTSEFILPASILQDSIALASENLRKANRLWSAAIPPEKTKTSSSPSVVRLASLLIDADFSGAVVSLQGRQDIATDTVPPATRSNRAAGGGKYGQYIQHDAETTATLRAPGVALKVQFEDSGDGEPTLNAEMKVDASTNVLHPTVVPLITQISESVKEIVGESDGAKDLPSKSQPAQDLSFEKPPDKNDPTTILGRCKLNVGLRICRQEFTLSCQPIARVLATACFDDSYITVNTVQSAEQRRFFAMSLAFNALQASVKHVYSSESTASLTVDSIVMSMMNSKHVSSSSGISAILKISPTKLQVNAKQVQDFLLFREIWVPPEGPPKGRPVNPQPSATDTQAYLVQRYQQMTATSSFPWNAVIAITRLDIYLDLGQTLGKSEFTIKDLWLSSKKTSDWEQNLCFGFEDIAVESKGRLSGAIGLQEFKVRTSIQWPEYDQKSYQTPLIQASVGFGRLQAKVSFEYQPFLVADVISFAFFMYNVRNTSVSQKDYLVSVLEGDNFQVFCTSFTASQGLALYQTLQRFLQEKQTAYQSSLKEIERFLRRKSTIGFGELQQTGGTPPAKSADEDDQKMPISLHTEVVVLLKSINIGAFPGAFHDHQIFKLVALDAEARFSVAAVDGRIHSGLGLTLGQLKVALSSVSRPATAPESAPEDLSVHDIVMRADEARGGTILNVPRVIASMETWQTLHSNQIDYIFKSSFEGKVDVGWNYSRISFIRGMWTNHTNTLSSRLGKPLPQPTLQITRERGEGGEGGEDTGQGKITAVVNVPQSRYVYTALEPPVIETPQLRDMGEATPPLEWIGLHRDKLPHITHQIIIVTLMEIAKDVEDAYTKILGSS